MIVEIGGMLVNTDSICTVKRCRYEKDNDSGFNYCLEMYYNTGKTELISFPNEADRDIGYQTLRLFETVVNKTRTK